MNTSNVAALSTVFCECNATPAMQEYLAAFSCKRHGLSPSCGAGRMAESAAHSGAFTLIQRFCGTLNLNIHFHMLFLNGVYVDSAGSVSQFR